MSTRRRWGLRLGVAFATAAVCLAVVCLAEAGKPKVELFETTVNLERDEGQLGELEPPARLPGPGRGGGTIVADAGGLWILERNAGALIRSDHAGEVRATLPLHEGLGELVLDPGKQALFVADRSADRLLRFTVAGDVATPAGALEIVEPHGLALSPDGATVLVTSVADHELLAVDTASMQVRWRVRLPPEPRAVAVSPDGAWALVGFLATGAVARLALGDGGKRLADAPIQWHALSPRDPIEIEVDFEEEWGESVSARPVEAPSRFDVPKDTGRRHARNVFALAFVGDGIAVAAHQVATPQMELRPTADRRDAYGGGAAEVSPIEYRLARIAEPGADGLALVDQHHVTVHQPRALAYDRARDVLYVGGYGDDEIVAIARASRERPMMAWRGTLGAGVGCGLDGLTLLEPEHVAAGQGAGQAGASAGAGTGDTGTGEEGDSAAAPAPTEPGAALWAHCELTRSVVRIDLDPESVGGRPLPSRQWIRGPELAASLRSAEVERGAEIFRRGEDFSLGGALACASCHPEGRNDGLSWRLGRSILQTPILAGRVAGTAPYKWTGEDPSLQASFSHTIERIGGEPEALDRRELDALAAYLTSLPKPRPPTVADPAARDRGRAVFADACELCHSGEVTTDRERHEFATTMRKVDTPSLAALAHSAPYYHDGSALDLQTLLEDRGSVHDMVDTSELSPAQRADLIVYLLSL